MTWLVRVEAGLPERARPQAKTHPTLGLRRVSNCGFMTTLPWTANQTWGWGRFHGRNGPHFLQTEQRGGGGRRCSARWGWWMARTGLVLDAGEGIAVEDFQLCWWFIDAGGIVPLRRRERSYGRSSLASLGLPWQAATTLRRAFTPSTRRGPGLPK